MLRIVVLLERRLVMHPRARRVARTAAALFPDLAAAGLLRPPRVTPTGRLFA
jgi:hypothetical protein